MQYYDGGSGRDGDDVDDECVELFKEELHLSLIHI